MSGREVFEVWTPLPMQIGELVALANDGVTPMVIDPRQPEPSAREARSVVDLHADHIGRPVVLLFEGGDPSKPIIMGVLRGSGEDCPAGLAVEADGERLLVSAREQLVLRCGRASITLTKAGKVVIEGTYLSSKSTGANRIRGGSIQLN